MLSSWLTDCSHVIQYAENHGFLGYLATLTVMVLALPFFAAACVLRAVANQRASRRHPATSPTGQVVNFSRWRR